MAHTTPHMDPAAVSEAARMTLEGLNMMRPRLAHAYGCPSQHAGPCTCGLSELIAGTEALVAALQADVVPESAPETTKKH